MTLKYHTEFGFYLKNSSWCECQGFRSDFAGHSLATWRLDKLVPKMSEVRLSVTVAASTSSPHPVS